MVKQMPNGLPGYRPIKGKGKRVPTELVAYQYNASFAELGPGKAMLAEVLRPGTTWIATC